ncbi:hypothetical protein [Pedobacter punctiformis]|uniref:Uncharacterized protein n=1 Tax=Pedobacter punctiformis TaxID=3004097 RepID=A0ABT4LB28_9SPHI|nr:hypothetical protein [Pedobacter sp. HCMS5-2]MCZ4245125.1 hypothetical protein [Pedobacter sp. HCMS5-2]
MKTNQQLHLLMPKYILVLCLLFMLAACKKTEEKLSPTERPEYGYSVPQGNNNFDDRIVAYHKRWGTYLLYKFNVQDFTWQITGYDKYYKSVGSNEAYINQQLDLLDNTFFKYYQDSTLTKYLPSKFFLCSSLTFQNKRVDAFALTSTFIGGYESFAVNWGNKGILNISSPIDSVSIFRGNVNYSFLKIMNLKGRMGMSDVFQSITDYVATISPTAPATNPTNADLYKRGFLGNSSISTPSNQTDWYSYLQVILSNKYANLINPATTATDVSAKGILSPVKDVNGLVRRKYDAMIKFYKEVYNIDLQKIGDGL